MHSEWVSPWLTLCTSHYLGAIPERMSLQGRWEHGTVYHPSSFLGTAVGGELMHDTSSQLLVGPPQRLDPCQGSLPADGAADRDRREDLAYRTCDS